LKSISPDFPWLSAEVIAWLEATLLRNWTVVETGAGGSTVFFASRVDRVVAFEHNLSWFEKVRGEVASRRLTNVQFRFEPAYPTVGLSGLPACDLAFIDGRGRVRSALDALEVVRPGGWLVLDDSNRERYIPAIRVLDRRATEKLTFRSGPDHTAAWKL